MFIANFLANYVRNIKFKLLLVIRTFLVAESITTKLIFIKYRKIFLKVINNYRFPDFLFI